MNELLKTISAPQRIISVVPSQTELLYDLGLRDEVIGITKFCIHPNEWFLSKTRVGGTKNLHIDRIHTLQPDLILANKEENTKAQIEELQHQYPVYVSDINDIPSALRMISDIGELVHKQNQAEEIISTIEHERKQTPIRENPLSTIYLIWQDPYMAAGNDTFINDMLREAGFNNCMLQARYPILSDIELQNMKPELILLSSEPFPFKQKHIDALSRLCPNAQIRLVDGELFSWYGSRMSQSFKYFSGLHEDLR
jgi:ABC-type Fe3+-hydroxamate transport system substrate-binding protein